ncbi:MAG: TlpA disulfide reductase family protein [Myxococcota bacterium]|nr:TlpA disulfide reductase family protein [Myxococcota bacterium]
MSEPSRWRRSLRAAWPWLLMAGAIGLWTFGRGGPAIEEGAPAPALVVPWTGGGELDLGAREGKVTVLAFWATWCGACRAEGPVLSRVHERLRERGDEVIGVSVDELPLERVHDRARAYGMDYPIALASRADTDRFQVELLPTIYVIGPDRRIAAAFTGGVGESSLMEAVERARARSK